MAQFDKQGHRGCRGLMPENTIPAMLKALELGVTTLEMDVHITKDRQVVLSHDAYLNAHFISSPNLDTLTEEEGKALLIYGMPYTELRRYDAGMKPYALFPRQQKIRVSKPLLADLIDSVEQYGRHHHDFAYNIEIKSSPKGDGKKHPVPEAYADLVMQVINRKGIGKRVTIQSFDNRPLQYLHSKFPDLRLSLLIEPTEKRAFSTQIDELGFTPKIYSPHYSLVNEKLIEICHAQHIHVIPWTVNDLETMKDLKKLGVDGIISDYPDLFQQLP